ncbi:MAG: hypothetical protein Fur0037_21910 [Planctomycetota bacterium]
MAADQLEKAWREALVEPAKRFLVIALLPAEELDLGVVLPIGNRGTSVRRFLGFFVGFLVGFFAFCSSAGQTILLGLLRPGRRVAEGTRGGKIPRVETAMPIAEGYDNVRI